MLVRVCPKCGAENKSTSTTCAKCYAVIENVEVSTGTRVEPTLPPSDPRPAATRPPSQQASRSSEPTQSVPTGYQPTQQFGPPPYDSSVRITSMHPIRKGPNAWAIATVIVVLLGILTVCGFLFLAPKPMTPEEEVRHALKSLDSANWDEVKSHLTKATLDQMIALFGSEDKLRRMTKSDASSRALANLMGRRDSTAIKTIRFEGKDKASVDIAMPPEAETQLRALGMQDMKIELIMIREEERYKLDLPQTQQAMIEQIKKMVSKRMKGMPMPSGFGFSAPGAPQPNAGFQTPPQMPVPPPQAPPPPPAVPGQ